MIIVEHPGQHTTIQDLGRQHHRADGIPVGGAVDTLALRVANMIVGNPEDAACLECMLAGPVLQFKCDALISICGARIAGVETWKPLQVRAGKRLELSTMQGGAYTYIAVHGGMNVPQVLGSRCTDTRIGWGGLDGRALKTGDEIPIRRSLLKKPVQNWSVAYENWYSKTCLRFLRGSEREDFDIEIEPVDFKVTSQIDRMGVRLSGEALVRKSERQLSSSPMIPGTIQVPPDGQPIVLLADAQTLGGYPKFGHVISFDLPAAAQLRPGETTWFRETEIEWAHSFLKSRERELSLLRQAVAGKLIFCDVN